MLSLSFVIPSSKFCEKGLKLDVKNFLPLERNVVQLRIKVKQEIIDSTSFSDLLEVVSRNLNFSHRKMNQTN
jgi:hypothetical protein